MEAAHVIEISMSSETVSELKKLGFVLCLFQGINTDSRHVVPLVTQVFSHEAYHGTTTLTVSSDCLAGYISTQPLTQGAEFKVHAPSADSNVLKTAASDAAIYIKIGQEMIITTAGTLTPKNEAADFVKISSRSKTQYSTGIGNVMKGDEMMALYCATSIINGATIKLRPNDKVLLTFTNVLGFKSGAYIKTLSNFGMVIETSATEKRKVSYTISNGWDANKASWAKQYESGADLENILVSNLS